MKYRVPEKMRDEKMREEIIRLFEETKSEMRSFEKLFILVLKD
jgi:hypothetical protein